MKSSVDLLHPQVFLVIMDRANYKFCSLGNKFCFKTVLVTFSLSILHEHTFECVSDSLLGCGNWEANEVWAITSHTFTFSHGYEISLCHLFSLKPAPYTTLPTNQLTPASL